MSAKKHICLLSFSDKPSIYSIKYSKPVFAWGIAIFGLLFVFQTGLFIWLGYFVFAEKSVSTLEYLEMRQNTETVQIYSRLVFLQSSLARTAKREMKIRTIMGESEKTPRFRYGNGLHGVGPLEKLPSPAEYLMDTQNGLKKMMEKIDSLMEDTHSSAMNVESSLHETISMVLQKKKQWMHTPSVRPASGRITSGFGWRVSPFFSGREFHKGLDIANFPGTPIRATASGTVIFAGWDHGYGITVKIANGYGYKTVFAHMRKAAVVPGEKVRRGELIGYMGSTGLSTGPHVHYEVRVDNVAHNPLDYIINTLR